VAEDAPIDADVARTFLTLTSDLPVGTEVQITMVFGRPPDLIGQRVPVAATLAEDFRLRALLWITTRLQYELVRYEPGRSLLDGEASFRWTAEIPQASELLDLLDNWLDLTLFDPTNAPEQPNFYVVSLRDRGGPAKATDRVHLLRKLDRQYRLKRSRAVALVLRDGTYETLVEEPVILSDDFDAALTRELTIVTNQRNLDAMLGFVDDARRHAEATLREVTQDLNFINYTDFEAAVINDLNMLSKLRSIVELRTDKTYAEAMKMERIVEFVKENPHLGIDLVGAKGAEQFVFHNDPQRRWKLLRLLDDQFVRSLITELTYEANSKSRLA
jgi:Domain of unknown function (DUF4868)